MDDVSRKYLQDLTNLRGLPKPVRRLVGRTPVLLTLGWLPPEFRAELGLPWTARDEARFDRITRRLAWLNRSSPRFLRQLPMNLYLWDVRRRLRTGRRACRLDRRCTSPASRRSSPTISRPWSSMPAATPSPWDQRTADPGARPARAGAARTAAGASPSRASSVSRSSARNRSTSSRPRAPASGTSLGAATRR